MTSTPRPSSRFYVMSSRVTRLVMHDLPDVKPCCSVDSILLMLTWLRTASLTSDFMSFFAGYTGKADWSVITCFALWPFLKNRKKLELPLLASSLLELLLPPLIFCKCDRVELSSRLQPPSRRKDGLNQSLEICLVS